MSNLDRCQILKPWEPPIESAVYRLGLSLVWVSWLFTTKVAAQTAEPHCSTTSTPAVEGLVRLLNQLQALGVELAVPGAALGYTVAGLLWLSGLTSWQRSARTLFTNVTIGLIVVLLAGAFVAIVTGPLCGGV